MSTLGKAIKTLDHAQLVSAKHGIPGVVVLYPAKHGEGVFDMNEMDCIGLLKHRS